MDQRRFDQWTRTLTTRRSRRATVKSLAAGLFGAVLVQLTGDEAEAKCIRPGRKCDRRNPKKDTCCDDAKCRGQRCRCPRGRAACGRTCCPKGDICAGGRCVIGAGNCPAGTNSCADAQVFCGGNPTCLCTQRVQGGTRCSQASEDFICHQCVTDAECRQLGYPPGSACVQANGPQCGCPTIGSCATPCGIAQPTV